MLGTGIEFYLVLVVFAIPGIVLGFTVHEYCHAAVATGYGDPLPRRQGRLSLNPGAQVDPLGLVLLLTVGFGFARPVVYNPMYVRRGRQRAWLAAAGPLSNLVLAAALGLLAKVVILTNPWVQTCSNPSFALPVMGIVYWVLVSAVYVNLVLFIFNLLPIPPLDGFGVAEGLFRGRHPAPFQWVEMHRTEIYIGLILVVLVLPQLLGGLSPLSIPAGLAFNWLWSHAATGAAPPIYFPNIAYLFLAGGQSLAGYLLHPCFIT
ncbi:MAG: site-2 protease family protein [Candidatus Dormibacteria bacterium]